MAGINVTTPVGRVIRGNTNATRGKTDTAGKPKLGKDGVTQMQECYFEVSIAKGAEQHWAQTEWGAKVYQVGAQASPTMYQNPAFAWKIVDGDSGVPNRKGKVPNQTANYPGHWILKLSSGFVPQRFRRNAAGAFEQINDDQSIKLGYYVQVQLSVTGNGSTESPGVYLNPNMVCLSAFGEEIYVGPDVESAGFGAAPLPPGASAVPLAGQVMPAAPGAPIAPLIPGLPAVPALPAAIAPPPLPVAVAPVVPQLVPVVGATHTIERLRAGGWTDDQIVAGNYATRPAPGVAPLPPAISAPVPAAAAAPIAPALAVTPNPAFPVIPAPAAGPQLSPAGVAAGGTYANFQAQGWNDAQLRAAGYLA